MSKTIVYMGPSIRNVILHGVTLKGGYTPALEKELEKQLRNLGGKPAAGNATGSNDELQKKMKKLEEDKQKAESLLEALKNQK